MSFRLAIICCVAASCSSSQPAAIDAGVPPVVDANAAPSDTGGMDGGSLDAAPVAADSGLRPDVQSPAPDAGSPPADPLDALLDAWFADYNADQGLNYLETPGFVFADGDPNMEDMPEHTYYQGAAYGPHSRNLLDFWQPEATEPTGVAVFIHGGGFVSGERESLRDNNSLRRLLRAGIAVASISYRWAYRNPSPALRAPRPNDRGETHDQNGTRIDYILRDCARSIQYLRYRANDWNIDVERVGAWGGSAGAGCSMWTASVPDLAQPDHSDPVLRQSSRLRVAGHNYGQVTYAFDRWPELLGFDQSWLLRLLGNKQTAVTQMSVQDFTDTEEGQQLAQVLDYYAHLDLSDPPFISTNQTEDLPQSQLNQSWQVLHHVRGHYALYDRCQALGMTCALRTQARNEGFDSDLVAYLIEHLRTP